MRIIVSNTIRIIEPDTLIKNYAEEKFVISNPDYERNKRLGYSNYSTPMYLVYYEMNGNELILPFGCLLDLFRMYPQEIFENRIILGEHITYNSKIELFDYQERMCEKAIHAKNGILVMPARKWKNTDCT